MSKQKIMVAGGVGESKPFIAPEGTFPENPILDCHVGGRLVRDLDPDMQAKILYQQTDEGIAERDEGRVPAGSAARVTAGPLDKAIQERRDDLATGMEPWEARDPLKEVADAHTQPGQRPKFLSPPVIQSRGLRGFEVVKSGGDPVRVGNMVLGVMPEAKAEQRNRRFREKSKSDLVEVEKRYKETQEQQIREAGL